MLLEVLTGDFKGQLEDLDLVLEAGPDCFSHNVETVAELTFLRDIGVYLFQGYLLARPAYEQIPEVDWSKVPA